MSNKLLDLIKSSNAKWVDFRFTDTRGKEQHISFPASTIDEDVMEDGKMFDGSSIAGWKGIEASDMILRPDKYVFSLIGRFASWGLIISLPTKHVCFLHDKLS